VAVPGVGSSFLRFLGSRNFDTPKTSALQIGQCGSASHFSQMQMWPHGIAATDERRCQQAVEGDSGISKKVAKHAQPR
jgi:hypothetical protein